VGVLEKHQSFKLDNKIVKGGTKLANSGGRGRERSVCVCVSLKSVKF